MALEQHREEWDRRKAESDEAWEAFCVYRDQQPPRSLREAGKTLGKSKALLARWSGQHDWVARVAAWDRETDRARREADLKGRAEMGKRHAQEAAELGEVLLMPAREIARRWKRRMEADPDGDPFKDLSDLDLIKEATKAARVYAQVGIFERLARGLSTSNVGGHDGGAIAHEVEFKDRVEQMPRGKLEEYLMGLEDGANAVAEEYGLPAPPSLTANGEPG